MMKRMMLAALCVLAAVGAVSAQTGNRPGPDAEKGFAPPAQETISGNLGISRGMISLESGGLRYYVRGLNRFIGFIEGLREGAAVSLTGYAFESPRLSGAKIFRVVAMQLGGKSYDLAPPVEAFSRPGDGPRNNFSHPGNFRFHGGDPGYGDRGPGYRGRDPGHHRQGWDNQGRNNQGRNGQGRDNQSWNNQGRDNPDRRGSRRN
ncbi:MAG: hypothetical protein LBK27_04610 [Treponema sp.]|jgi:hypothetical protein|nr:hypothetical protein [Treponema sp.]